ncbi:hypothetical protein DCCM_0408 [Desulfocucumis palustris]|uniref:Peptidase C39-like domain-containing protein n=1 Tax=Desulfocucumis palustris TaxID=1898651 RepID=A0A2L2X7P3_9FIRM|nr:C39 family peptidase [Desulfocucumis palustris]GBF32217.1 hypothetical protein DCCM_0408 [Desulfocucumis palustris]
MAEFKKPVHYLQTDKKWSGIMFSNHNDPKQTIGSSGCGAASFAMILTAFTGKAVYPPEIAKIIVDNGYRTYNNGVDWGFFAFAAGKYCLDLVRNDSADEAIKALQKGALIVASMGSGYFTKSGHYIVLWGLDEINKQILVNDPNSTVRTRAPYDLFRREGRMYFIFYKKDQVQNLQKEGDEVAKLMIDDPEQAWKINAARESIDELAARGLLNDPEMHKAGLEKLPDYSMEWLSIVLLNRIAEAAGVRKRV